MDFFGTLLVIESRSGRLSSDAGLLPPRQLDQRIGLTAGDACVLLSLKKTALGGLRQLTPRSPPRLHFPGSSS